ncbi:MAG: response regulator transcription factor, partial [Thermodesulfobacteriota bacterium]
MKKAKILIVDDHPIVRNGLKSILSRNPDYLLVGEAENGEEAYKKVLELKPDIVVLDIVMPRLGGIQVAERIKKFHPKTKIIILSMYKQKEYALCALRAGVDGFVLKDQASERLLDALDSVRAGKRYICPDVARYLAEEYIQFTKNNTLDPFYSLSLREKEVLSLIVEG